MTTPTSYFCIKIQSAPKTSLHAKGLITYAVLRDADNNDAYVCLLGNEGGGFFSQEAVSFSAIKQCLQGINTERPIPAKTFKAAFRGRSANNSGFLVTALRHEKLLLPAPDAAHQHIVGSGWDEWRESVLAEGGEPFVLPEVLKAKANEVADISNADELPEHRKSKKPRKSPEAKRELPSSGVENDHVGAA